MAATYSGAVVVIAADAASNATEGCFGPFSPSPGSLESVTIPCINDNGILCQVYARIWPNAQWHGAGHYGGGLHVHAPLPQRAWVRLLDKITT